LGWLYLLIPGISVIPHPVFIVAAIAYAELNSPLEPAFSGNSGSGTEYCGDGAASCGDYYWGGPEGLKSPD
jgi:hypothetical protein